MLYVFVHGLAVVCVRPTDQKLVIVIPQVNGHLYKAGSWLAETSIENPNLELTGVETGKADIYRNDFLINVPQAYKVTANGRAATMVAPKPDQFLGLMLAEDSKAVATLKSPQPQNYTKLADVLVLAYKYGDENQVVLQGHYWQPCVTRGAMSLHIIATSETPEGAQHRAATDTALKVVYENFPGLAYPVPAKLRAPWMDSKNPNLGDLQGRHERGGHIYESNGDFAFSLAEAEHPAPRLQRLERLGRMHRGDRRIQSLWCRPDPLNDSMGGPCGGQTGFLG